MSLVSYRIKIFNVSSKKNCYMNLFYNFFYLKNIEVKWLNIFINFVFKSTYFYPKYMNAIPLKTPPPSPPLSQKSHNLHKSYVPYLT